MASRHFPISTPLSSRKDSESGLLVMPLPGRASRSSRKAVTALKHLAAVVELKRETDPLKLYSYGTATADQKNLMDLRLAELLLGKVEVLLADVARRLAESSTDQKG